MRVYLTFLFSSFLAPIGKNWKTSSSSSLFLLRITTQHTKMKKNPYSISHVHMINLSVFWNFLLCFCISLFFVFFFWWVGLVKILWYIWSCKSNKINKRRKKNELEESIEVCTGCSCSHPSPLLHAFAGSQARPCRLLLLVVSFPFFFYFFFFFFQFCCCFLWVFDFCWVGLVFWDFDCFHNVCGVEKCKKNYGFCFNLCFGVLNRWKNSWGFFVFFVFVFCFCFFSLNGNLPCKKWFFGVS